MGNRGIVAAAIGLLLLIGAPAASAASGPATLTAAGWTCFVPPGDVVHCQPPGTKMGNPTITLRVFGGIDPSAASAPFLGTELLVREDLYHGQPCPRNEWIILPFGYRACHHFAG